MNRKSIILILALAVSLLSSTTAGAQLIQPINPAGIDPMLGKVDFRVREWRNETIPTFRTKVDNFTQFAPLGVMYGMKLAGVEGRGSSWRQIGAGSAASMGIMLLSTTAMKYSICVMRPDGSSANSFPSGHTANAFMCATLLHNEYGRDYPWISVAGYSVAALTGLSRIANNRHWLSDVLTGALIGVLSAKAGDYLGRKFFRPI